MTFRDMYGWAFKRMLIKLRILVDIELWFLQRWLDCWCSMTNG